MTTHAFKLLVLGFLKYKKTKTKTGEEREEGGGEGGGGGGGGGGGEGGSCCKVWKDANESQVKTSSAVILMCTSVPVAHLEDNYLGFHIFW